MVFFVDVHLCSDICESDSLNFNILLQVIEKIEINENCDTHLTYFFLNNFFVILVFFLIVTSGIGITGELKTITKKNVCAILSLIF